MTVWNVLDSYFQGSFLTDLQLDSYNDMVYQVLPRIIKQQQLQIRVNKFHLLHLEFNNVYIPHPMDITSTDKVKLYPQDARLRNLTYDTQVLVDITYHVIDIATQNVVHSNQYTQMELFRLPVMVYSGVCNLTLHNRQSKYEDLYDYGGYFIIKGKERVLMSQERINYNMIYVFKQKNAKYTYAAEVRSVKEDADYSVMTRISLSNDHHFYCSLPYLNTEIPVVVLLLAFDIPLDTITHPLFQRMTYRYKTMSSDAAMEYICERVPNHMDSSRKRVYVQQIFENELFPHLGLNVSPLKKGEYIQLMVQKLISTALGERPPDDRDHICNKRVEMSGDLIGTLLKSMFKRSLKGLEQHIQKKEDYNIAPYFQRCNITQKLLQCFTTGNWGLPKSNYIRQGVSQVLNRLSFIGTMSHLRRLAVPIGKESKNTDVRQIHSSTYGFICPVECFDPETPILLWSGCVKLAKEIVVGDVLADENGQPTRVRKTCAGVSEMVDVTQLKSDYMDYRVTSNHILTLRSSTNQVVDLTIAEYLALDITEQERLFGFKHGTPMIDDSPICVEAVGLGAFVGWQLDGNGRFLGADGTVLHNTPEGQTCGIIKSFAMGIRLSHTIDTVLIQELLRFVEVNISSTPLTDATPVLVNGVLHGYTCCADASNLTSQLRMYRDQSLIPASVSIVYNELDNELLIQSDRGRLLRPVFRTRPGLLQRLAERPSWTDLVDEHWIVYIDGGEAETSYISMTLTEDSSFDYCEVHPFLMLSVSANFTPFPEHSQAPRNIYHAAQSKQGIGVYALPFQHRFDTTAHVLHYPQKQMVATRMMRYAGLEEVPSGHTVIVAIACYTGFNMEDSVILNKGAIDRGLFRVTTYKTIVGQENKLSTHERENIERTDKFQHPGYNYNKLGPDGVVRVGETIDEYDVVIGKLFYENEQPIRDCSVTCKSNEKGIVDSVVVTVSASGYKLVKIRVRQLKVPEIGDKVASFHAQKGTIGGILLQEDMPFTRDGIVPDLILNPNAIPSRMTINMLLDIICGKKGVLDGTYQDATAFCHSGEELVEKASQVLLDKGYEKMGYERMINGMTGEMLQSQLFIGPTYYQRLKHIVSEKIHARGKGGNIQMMSRQPCAGRSKDGGLRLGEMERDALITHGTASFLKERLFDLSDPYQMDVCRQCGAMVHNTRSCMMCSSHETDRVHIPYACKLLFQNLQALGLRVDLFPDQ